MECPQCGEVGVELQVNETWAGTWHSACCHRACLPCVRQWVNASLEQCRAQGQLRVQCYHPGCKKSMPQKLVLNASLGARLLAEAIDRCGRPQDWPVLVPCSQCGATCRPLVNESCGHGACENCWERWAEQQLPFCQTSACLSARCLQQDCREAVCTTLWHQILAPSEAVISCIALAEAADAAWKRLQNYGGSRFAAAPADPGPCCEICNSGEHQIALLENVCGHAACEDCWSRWTEVQLDDCIFRRAMDIRCIGQDCISRATSCLWEHACTRSEQVLALDQQFKRRLQLQRNTLFPEVMQVDCPQPRCVGLGYLGFDTVMCFLCEHQWVPEDSVGEAPLEADVEMVMGVKVKRCPKCSQYIEKNGGCDHMTCRHRGCGYEFWWSTLKPYRAG